MADHAIFFHEYQAADQPIVGGKCASLGAMTQAGLPVPPGFAVTTHAFAGLPAVTGTAFATKSIKTGMRLRVDGDNGVVTILD